MDAQAPPASPKIGWKGGVLIVIAALLLMTAIGTAIILLVVEQRLDQIETSVSSLEEVHTELESLDQSFPFTPPENQTLDRRRLRVFFQIVEDIAAALADAGPEQTLEQQVAAVMNERGMGPTEFVWIANQAEAAWLKRTRGFQGEVPAENIRLIEPWTPRMEALLVDQNSPRYGVVDLIRTLHSSPDTGRPSRKPSTPIRQNNRSQ